MRVCVSVLVREKPQTDSLGYGKEKLWLQIKSFILTNECLKALVGFVCVCGFYGETKLLNKKVISVKVFFCKILIWKELKKI